MNRQECGRPVSIDDRRLRCGDDQTWDLIGSSCPQCGSVYHPIRPYCRLCGAENVTRVLRPKGTVVATTTVRVTRPDVLLNPPYQVALVRLADGPLVRFPSRSLEELEPGTVVDVLPIVIDQDGRSVVACEAMRR